ncbi:DUF222 domain-containing protein [Streptomyces sp. NPDC057099]|uniref:DUF222 domain-containing protein n=1 Tax=Streptomyces sp. NPDC057099 TaxID=3346019 RepID=UPI00363DE2A6
MPWNVSRALAWATRTSEVSEDGYLHYARRSFLDQLPTAACHQRDGRVHLGPVRAITCLVRVTPRRELMSAVEMSRSEAVALVQRVMGADYASDDEVADLLDGLDRSLACPSAHIKDLIFWPPERELSAGEVVDQALAYRPIAL